MIISPHKIRVAFSVTNCICYDQRVLKMAETVSSLGCEITIIGRKRGQCCNSGSVPFRTKRFRMIFNKGFLFYKFFNIRLFIYLLFHRFDILVANDLDTLLPNYLVSKIKRLPLVYDSHEYFTGVPEIQNRMFVRWVWELIEKSIFPRLKNMITVSEPIADLYEKLYRVRPIVVRNLSKNAHSIAPFTRAELGIPEDDLLIVIQGTGINIDKGAEELIAAVSITDGVSLLVVGSGDIVSDLKHISNNLNINYKIFFINTVPWDILIKYTKSADAGMCLEKDTNLNYRYSLPNKLFDYIAAGIPVIASDLPETRKIICENSCGVLIESVTPENISRSLIELINNPARLAQMRKNAALASEKYNWDNESEKVIEFYTNIVYHVPQTARRLKETMR